MIHEVDRRVINQKELVGTLLKAQKLEEQTKQETKKASVAPKSKEEKNPQRREKKLGPLSLKSEPWKTEHQRFQPKVFTLLNASFTKVFMAIKGDPTFRWPPRMKIDPFKRDRSKFCEYHEDHGHSTEDCMVLRQKIEVFVRNRKLLRFLAQERGRETNQQGPLSLEGNREGLRDLESRHREPVLRRGQYGHREEEQRNARKEQRPHQNQEIVREIHTISGRIAGGGESNSARKAYARSMQNVEVYSLHRLPKAARMESVILSFSEEDARG